MDPGTPEARGARPSAGRPQPCSPVPGLQQPRARRLPAPPRPLARWAAPVRTWCAGRRRGPRRRRCGRRSARRTRRCRRGPRARIGRPRPRGRRHGGRARTDAAAPGSGRRSRGPAAEAMRTAPLARGRRRPEAVPARRAASRGEPARQRVAPAAPAGPADRRKVARRARVVGRVGSGDRRAAAQVQRPRPVRVGRAWRSRPAGRAASRPRAHPEPRPGAAAPPRRERLARGAPISRRPSWPAVATATGGRCRRSCALPASFGPRAQPGAERGRRGASHLGCGWFGVEVDNSGMRRRAGSALGVHSTCISTSSR